MEPANVLRSTSGPSIALREPAAALLRRAVRPGLRIDLALGALLDAIVPDRACRVDAAVDVSLGQALDQPVSTAWFAQTPA